MPHLDDSLKITIFTNVGSFLALEDFHFGQSSVGGNTRPRSCDSNTSAQHKGTLNTILSIMYIQIPAKNTILSIHLAYCFQQMTQLCDIDGQASILGGDLNICDRC